MIDFQRPDGKSVRGYLAEGGAGAPAVVVIQEWWGLNDQIRGVADRFARAGFTALVPDLYRGQSTVEAEEAHHLMNNLNFGDAASQDVRGALQFLKARGGKVGVTGFCMGGSYALLAACSVRGLAAAVPFYGLLSYRHGLLAGGDGPDRSVKPREPLDAAADLRCPLLAVFGEQDEFVPLSDVRELEKRLAAAAHPSEVAIYPGCGHAFLNDTRPAAYRPEQARHAWARMVEHFRKQL
jgi:carboxymethylenebutenolidase